jgi:hypothetical protein
VTAATVERAAPQLTIAGRDLQRVAAREVVTCAGLEAAVRAAMTRRLHAEAYGEAVNAGYPIVLLARVTECPVRWDIASHGSGWVDASGDDVDAVVLAVWLTVTDRLELEVTR